MLVTEQMREKWTQIVEAEAAPVRGLSDTDISIRLLENQSKWNTDNLGQVNEASSAPGSVNSHVGKWQPILIAMAKRLGPINVAMEFFGVQPLAGPDGQIFAMRARKGLHDGTPANGQHSAPELFVDEADAGFSGDGVAMTGDPSGFTAMEVTGAGDTTPTTAGAKKTTAQSEVLGSDGNPWNKVGVTVQKASVTAESRGLYADYSHELRQDMMAVHGEDVDSILSDILVTEIQAEMNREFIRTMNIAAKLATKHGTAGVVDMTADTSGRWAQERWKYLLFILAVEAQLVGIETRRGKANKVLCSPNVASALSMAGMLDNTPPLRSQNNLNVDVTSQVYAGKLANGMDCYVDPYAGAIEYITLAYKGTSQLDAGAYFAPYVPLEMFRATGEDTFQPRMAFKTRYGLAANPFVQIGAGVDPATQVTSSGLGNRNNPYFRKMAITNLFAA